MKLADEVVAVLREFLTEMNAYERRWLAVRPIHEYCVSDISESRRGITSYSHSGPGPEQRPANPVQAVLWDKEAMHDEKHEALGEGKHWKQAVTEKRKIWKRFLTSSKRPGADYFNQRIPPYYDPVAFVEPEVRQVAPDHLIITYGQPRPPGTCGGTGRLCWHLRLEAGRWRIERHESVDNPAKPWKLDLA